MKLESCAEEFQEQNVDGRGLLVSLLLLSWQCVCSVMLLAFFYKYELVHYIVLKFQSLTIDEIKDMVQGDKQRK